MISHESALELYELSDAHPRRIHVTVPRAHRTRRQIPVAYRIHREDLDPRDVGRFEDIPIVTPERAIRQAHEADSGPALIAQALDHGERSGRLTGRQAKRLRDEMGLPKGSGRRR